MKKMTLFAAAALLLAGCSGRSLGIDTPDGKIVLTPLSENAVRVQMTGELDVPELEELIYDGETARVKYSVRRKDGVTSLKTAGMAVEYDAESGLLTFLDADGKVLLRESGRKVAEAKTGEVPCYDITEVFESPEGEFLYGTGQFQDGFLNIKGLTRRLTQVNTQI